MKNVNCLVDRIYCSRKVVQDVRLCLCGFSAAFTQWECGPIKQSLKAQWPPHGGRSRCVMKWVVLWIRERAEFRCCFRICAARGKRNREPNNTTHPSYAFPE